MPKSIIREFDKSTTGVVLSTNFAVLVPGYMGKEETEASIDEAKKMGIYYEDSGTYKLSSITQFEEFIGKFGGENRDAKAPQPEELGPVSAPTIGKYAVHINVNKFKDLGEDESTYYSFKELEDGEPGDGEDGYLLLTFRDAETGEAIATYKFTKVPVSTLWSDLPSSPEDAEQHGVAMNETKETYVQILPGNEGNDEYKGGDHMGNQIAYELLNLGYTVYFKKLDKAYSAASQLRQATFWEPLKNKSTYRIRYLTTGGCYDPAVANAMSSIAAFNNKVAVETADTYGNTTGRGDVIALVDIDEDDARITGATTKAALLKAFGDVAGSLISNADATKYSAIFAPRVVYNMPEDEVYGSDVKFPCSFHYLACAALAQQRYAEWYAVAGYARGISSKTIAYTTYNFGDIDINTLAPRTDELGYTTKSINLILNERGNYYLWGNRTAQPLEKGGLIFSHFLNIRQLCTTIKQVLYDATRQFTFSPNSDLLWINFVNVIKPTLENMKADQGIKGYKISRVATEKKALLVAKIRIVPIEALEDFDISIYLQDSLSGIIIDADEEVAE